MRVRKATRRQCVKCPATPRPVGNSNDDGKFQLRIKETYFPVFIKSPTDKNRYRMSLNCISVCQSKLGSLQGIKYLSCAFHIPFHIL